MTESGETTLDITYKFRYGTDHGRTAFNVKATGRNDTGFSLLSPEDALKLAEYLEQEVSAKRMVIEPSFEITGYALAIMCGNRRIKTLYDFDIHCKSADSFNYGEFKKTFPEFSSNDYYFVVYCLRDGGVTRERVDKVISACLDYQNAAIVSGDLRVCKPMTQLDIASITDIDNSTVSRAVAGARIYTAHRNYSLETGIKPLNFPSLFDEGIETEDGRKISTIGIKVMMNAIIEMEDKHHPLGDEQISQELKKYGYNIARRTVAKYREKSLCIPNSSQRKVK